MNHAELEALLTLRFTPYLGPHRIEQLVRHFGSASAVLSASKIEWQQAGLDSRSAQSLASMTSQGARKEIERCADLGITLVGRGLKGYPDALESLSDPPAALWIKGELPLLETVPSSIGIVGTRQASVHALSITRQLASELAQGHIIVVSGLARGIDTAAHTSAVECGGISLAVLGSAVDRIYPSENKRLAEKLVLVSEYPLGTGPLQHHFPSRNRIIAALSAGVVIVEGELKSGSMITATHALECGRSVFAVPGRAGDPKAAGPHRLLREGAVLTESAQDIWDELHWESTPQTKLAGSEGLVYEALTVARTLDDLMQLGLEYSELQTLLVMLQIEGHIEEVGGRWMRRGGMLRS